MSRCRSRGSPACLRSDLRQPNSLTKTTCQVNRVRRRARAKSPNTKAEATIPLVPAEQIHVGPMLEDCKERTSMGHFARGSVTCRVDRRDE